MILLLHNRYRLPGGEERAVEDLAWLIREHLGEDAEVLERDSAVLGNRRAARGLLRGGLAPEDVAHAVRRTGARVVHAHNVNPSFGWRALAAAREAGARVVLHLHNYRLVCAQGLCFTRGADCTRCHGRNTLPGVRLNCRGGSRAEAAAYAAGLALWQRRLVAQVRRVRRAERVRAAPAARARRAARRTRARVVGSVQREIAERSSAAAGPPRARRRPADAREGLRGRDRRGARRRAAARDRGRRPGRPPSCAPAPRAPTFVSRARSARPSSPSCGATAGAAVVPSRYAEILPLAALEAMAAGLPLVARRRRRARGGRARRRAATRRATSAALDGAAARRLWRDAAAGERALAVVRERFSPEAMRDAAARRLRRERLMVDRYLDALRHMRASQLLARPRRLVPPRWLAAGPQSSSTDFVPAARGAGVDTAPQSGPQPPPERDGCFRAIGHERRFGGAGFWTDDGAGLLFLFHLHGFADLGRYCAEPATAAGDAFWANVIRSWLDECGRPLRPAWHPFPLSGRVIAWSAALSRGGWDAGAGRRDARSTAPPAHAAPPQRRARHRRQPRASQRDRTGHRRGLHVRRPHRAASASTCSSTSSRASSFATEATRSAAPPTTGSSSGDLEDVVATLRQASRPVPGWLTTAATEMRLWLEALTGPDGRLPLLNDAWEGPPLDPVRREALTDLASSGYVVLRAGGDQAVLDVGPVAPPHLPPHAHADVLSFVLWADGARIVVDPGTFSYRGSERGRFRGTAAHSTVEIDGRDQCDLWGPFRAAHMPTVTRGALEVAGDAITLTAEHDGYSRLPDPVVHRRTFCWLPGDGLVVVDRLEARKASQVSTRLPLAPGLATDGQSAGPLRVLALGPGGPPVIEVGAYSPFLGQQIPASVIRRDLSCEPGVPFGWALVRPGTAVTLSDGVLTIERPGREPLRLVPG